MASKGRSVTQLRHAKACGRKTRFETERAALDSMRGTLADGNAQLGSLNVYRCRACKGFHVGHTPTWRRADLA